MYDLYDSKAAGKPNNDRTRNRVPDVGPLLRRCDLFGVVISRSDTLKRSQRKKKTWDAAGNWTAAAARKEKETNTPRRERPSRMARRRHNDHLNVILVFSLQNMANRNLSVD